GAARFLDRPAVAAALEELRRAAAAGPGLPLVAHLAGLLEWAEEGGGGEEAVRDRREHVDALVRLGHDYLAADTAYSGGTPAPPAPGRAGAALGRGAAAHARRAGDVPPRQPLPRVDRGGPGRLRARRRRRLAGGGGGRTRPPGPGPGGGRSPQGDGRGVGRSPGPGRARGLAQDAGPRLGCAGPGHLP